MLVTMCRARVGQLEEEVVGVIPDMVDLFPRIDDGHCDRIPRTLLTIVLMIAMWQSSQWL